MTHPEIVRIGLGGVSVFRLPGDPPHYVKICNSGRHAGDMRAVIAEAHQLGNGLHATAQRRFRIGGDSRPCYVTTAMPGQVIHPDRITDDMVAQVRQLWISLQRMTRSGSLYNHAPAVAALIGRPLAGDWSHGDFDVLHMYWQDRSLTGVIDFDAAMFSDARYDLALFVYSMVRHLPPAAAVDRARRLAHRVVDGSAQSGDELLAWVAGIARYRFDTIPGTQHIGPGEAALTEALWAMGIGRSAARLAAD